MKKYTSIYPGALLGSSSSLRSKTSINDIDVDDILSEIDQDVDRILHTSYMERLGRRDEHERDRAAGDGKARGGTKKTKVPSLDLQGADDTRVTTSRRGDTGRVAMRSGGKVQQSMGTLREGADEDGTIETARDSRNTPPHSDDEDSDVSDEGEEVNFSHTQTESINPQSALEGLRALMKEVNEKLEESNESMRENERLRLTVQELEEENHDLHEAMEEALKHVNQVNSTQALSVNMRVPNQAFRKAPTEKKSKPRDMFDLDNDDNEINLSEVDLQTNPFQLFKIIEAWVEKRFPFKNDIQRVHAVFGGTVSAYFLFNRWLVLQYSLVSSVVVVFITYHLIAQYDKPKIWEFSSGLLPNFMLFSSFDESERFNYSLMVILGMAIMLINVMLKYIREDKVNKLEKLTEGENYKDSYSKDVLIAWDNTLASLQEVEDYQGYLSQLFQEKLKDSEEAGIKRALSDLDKVILYARRFFGFFFFLAFQSVMYALIIYLTINTAEVKTMVEDFNPTLSTVAGSIPSIGVNIINSISPPIIEVITAFEQWDRAQTLNLLLSRMYIANMMNVLILGLSYMLLANPYLLADRSNLYIRDQIEAPFLPDSFPCRMDMVQNGFFQLIVTDWVTKCIGYQISGWTPYLVTKIIGGEYSKYEFQLPETMLSGIFSAGLVLMSWPFSPFSLILTPIMTAIEIKFLRSTLLYLYKKPEKQWKSQKALLMFTLLYLLTVLIFGVGLTVIFLNTETYPKSCAMQDSSVGLCAGGVEADNTCTLDLSSIYVTSANATTLCSPYPACVCAGTENTLACGPFANDINALRPVRDVIYRVTGLKYAWDALVGTSYGAWFMLIILGLLSSLRRNTVKVNDVHYKDTEKAQDLRIKVLEAENAKAKKTIAKYKAAREEQLREEEEEDGEEVVAE